MSETIDYDQDGATVAKRPDRAKALKKAHEAAAYDTWFRTQVQEAIDDTHPGVSDAEASDHMEKVFAQLENEARQ